MAVDSTFDGAQSLVKAVFLDYDTVSTGDLDLSGLRTAVGELTLYDSDDSQTAARIRDVEVVLLNKVELSRALLQGAPKLKLIAVAGTGTNNIDIVAARELGIAVCNVRGYCTASVVQHVWALILSLTQHVSGYSQMVRGGSWSHNEALMVQALPIRELSGRTFGVVGWGELGRGTARIAEAFGMRVAIANRRGATAQAGRLELEQLLAISDIVSLHCPLSDLTRGLIGARELSLMKPDALLINTARGALVDGHTLGMALKAGRLGGAGIDVLPQEPPLDDESLLDPGIPNLILTPHAAFYSEESLVEMKRKVCERVLEALGPG